MKKSIKIAALSFVLGFLVLSAQAQQKFGHLNVGDLLQSMPEMKLADASFQAFLSQNKISYYKWKLNVRKKL